MTENIFDQDGKPAVTDPVVPTKEELTNDLTAKLREIKNADGSPKYADPATALDALKHSQDYIPQLQTTLEEKERKLAELQAELDKRASVEDAVSKLLENQEPVQPQADPLQKPQLGQEDVAKIVASVLQQDKQQTVAESNVDKVQKELISRYGDKTVEVLNKVAQDNGTTAKDLQALAAKSPNLVLNLFKQEEPTVVNPAEGNVDTKNFQGKPNTELEAPTKSLLRGASTAEREAYMKKIKENVYKKYDVTT